MKNIAILLVCLTFIGANAQKITKKFLEGKWASETSEIEFCIENNKEFKIVDYSTLTNNYFKVVGYQFNKGFFYLNTIHESNNWEAIAKFIYIDNETMVADYVSKAPGQEIFKRVYEADKE
jgi:hypothetical protein